MTVFRKKRKERDVREVTQDTAWGHKMKRKELYKPNVHPSTSPLGRHKALLCV